jgi:heptosyltransferase I
MKNSDAGALFSEPPRELCLLRLSAIGDTCHVVPLIRSLQQTWPDTKITWIIGKVEHKLMRLLDGVEFITIDKRTLWHSLRALRTTLRGRHFDAVLLLQTAFRASLFSLAIPARVRLGMDHARARELQWLFSNRQIAPAGNQHMQDLVLGFVRRLGITNPTLAWNLAIPAEAENWAAQFIAPGQRTLIVSPCASHPKRIWSTARYAAVIDHAVQTLGMKAIICASPSAAECAVAADVAARCRAPVTNLAGQDTLPQLLALLGRATMLLTPDSGPAHMATMVGLPVIGLYAATRVARTGPYLSQVWCVDRYAAAARRFRGREPEALKWTAYVQVPGVMDLIEVSDVIERLEALLRSRT